MCSSLTCITSKVTPKSCSVAESLLLVMTVFRELNVKPTTFYSATEMITSSNRIENNSKTKT